MWSEFRAFVARGNVMDLAVAVIMGAAFGRIVSALVDGVLMPPLGVLLGSIDFSSLMVVLDRSRGVPVSLADARERGIPVVAYGQVLNEAVGFLIVAFVVFVLIKQVNRIKGTPPAPGPATRECPYCASAISLKATRCPHCTSSIERL